MPRVYLVPTAEQAQQIVDAHNGMINCIETEYGGVTVRGLCNNLVHHGVNSGNDAPCITNAVVNDLDCVVSHIDLDTIGGILRCWGWIKWGYNFWFWYGAAYVDVNGPQHLRKLDEDHIETLNAYWAWSTQQPRVRYTEVTNVTDQVMAAWQVIQEILDPWTLNKEGDVIDEMWAKQDARLEAGRVWASEQLAATEACLVKETKDVRFFVTEQVFCNGSYYSPFFQKDVPCVVSYNTKTCSITLSFFDDTCGDACEIMKRHFGELAGGHKGIAGTPRGTAYTREQAEALFDLLSKPEV